MRAHSEVVVASIADSILTQAETLNTANHRMKSIAPVYSSVQIFSILNEIGKQIAYQPE